MTYKKLHYVPVTFVQMEYEATTYPDATTA